MKNKGKNNISKDVEFLKFMKTAGYDISTKPIETKETRGISFSFNFAKPEKGIKDQ